MGPIKIQNIAFKEFSFNATISFTKRGDCRDLSLLYSYDSNVSNKTFSCDNLNNTELYLEDLKFGVNIKFKLKSNSFDDSIKFSDYFEQKSNNIFQILQKRRLKLINS